MSLIEFYMAIRGIFFLERKRNEFMATMLNGVTETIFKSNFEAHQWHLNAWVTLKNGKPLSDDMRLFPWQAKAIEQQAVDEKAEAIKIAKQTNKDLAKLLNIKL